MEIVSTDGSGAELPRGTERGKISEERTSTPVGGDHAPQPTHEDTQGELASALDGGAMPKPQRPFAALSEADVLYVEKRYPGGSQYPVVFEADLRAVGSVDDLRRLYEDRHLRGLGDEELFEQAKLDWKRIFFHQGAEELQKPFPSELPGIRLEADGQKYRLLGCIHNMAIGPEFLGLLINEIMKNPYWAVEHKLMGIEFLPFRFGVEIDDHSFRGLVYRALSETWNTWTSFRRIFRILPEMLKAAGKFREVNARIAEAANNPQSDQNPPKLEAEDTPIANRFFGKFEIHTRLPEDISDDYPANIDILRREHFGLGYTEVQLRSLYQAAFLRAWDPKQSFPPSDKMREAAERAGVDLDEKAVLAGRRHIREIEYFLTHEPKWGKRVVRRAERMANRCSENPQAHLSALSRTDLAMFFTPVAISLGSMYGAVRLLSALF